MMFVVASSIVAACLDIFRQRRRCIPFPIYLLLVYALQASSVLVMPDTIAEHGVDYNDNQAVNVAKVVPRPDDVVHPVYARATDHISTMSIVIAAHNEHKYMKRTLDSIYEETP